MPDNIEIIYKDFDDAIRGLTTALDSVINVEGDLKKANENLKASWEGDCKDKYYTQYKKIADKFADYKSCLEGMKDNLQVISASFEETDLNLKEKIEREANARYGKIS